MKYRRFLTFFVLLSGALAATAADYPSDPNWRATCARLAAVVAPVDTAPTGTCDAQALYYGIGVRADLVAARRCASAQRMAGEKDDPFAGAGILSMVYANGRGVPANLELAQKFACEVPGADAEMDGRLGHLQAMAKTPTAGRKRFDLCDDITSGMMGGICAHRDAMIAKISRDAGTRVTLEKLNAPAQAAFGPLQARAEAFFALRSDREVDQSGTARGAFVEEERAALREAFARSLSGFVAGGVPNDAAGLARADAALNEGYRKALAAAGDGTGMSGSLGTVHATGIRQTQRSWLGYREAWVAFGKIAWPTVPPDAWRTWATRERTAQLSKLHD